MSEYTTDPKKIVTITVDLNSDIISDLLMSFAADNLSRPSISILTEEINERSEDENRSSRLLFEAAGRAVFNDILQKATIDKLKREGFIDEDDDYDGE